MKQTLKLLLTISLITLPGLTSTYARETTSNPTIIFLDKEQAKKAIIDDSLEKYFEFLQPMEMAAKTGSLVSGSTIKEQRENCRKRYQDGALAFSKAEQDAISWHVKKLQPVLKKKYPLFAKMPWSFLKVTDNIEGGLPHTRGKHIVLSASLCKRIAMIQKLPPEQLAFLGILDLFVHEQMHVFQRNHPGHCDSLYTKVWGFKKAGSITGCKWLEVHHLANPDAVDCSWILPIEEKSDSLYLLPLVVFAEGEQIKRMPDDFRMIAISLNKTEKGFAAKLKKDGTPVHTQLHSVPKFKELFPMSSNIYHPHEASADMFSKVVIFDHFVPKRNLPPNRAAVINKTLAPLRKWFTDNLKTSQ